MNIAMFTNNYKPFIGGVPISIERLSEELRSLGHRITVFAPEPKESCQRSRRRMWCVLRFFTERRTEG